MGLGIEWRGSHKLLEFSMVVKCSDHNPRNPADPAVCLPSPARGHSPGHCLVLPSASRQLLQRVPWPRLVTPAPSLATSTLVPVISHPAAQAVGKDPALHPSTCNHSVASCCLWSKPQAWLSGPKYWTWPLPTSSSSSLSQVPSLSFLRGPWECHILSLLALVAIVCSAGFLFSWPC